MQLTHKPQRHQRPPVILRAVEERQVSNLVHIRLAGAVPLHKGAPAGQRKLRRNTRDGPPAAVQTGVHAGRHAPSAQRARLHSLVCHGRIVRVALQAGQECTGTGGGIRHSQEGLRLAPGAPCAWR